jgi:DNA helicase-2/ATP-dependent DNA helicase PcrA
MNSTDPTQHPLLEGLNERQKEAALVTNGPLLLLAGAGSGKTRTLTHRIAYLIGEKKVSPHQILAVTFTNKAATEMKKRTLELMYGKERATAILESLRGPSFHRTDLPVIGTFHSVCVQILRKHIHLMGYENRFAIYDDTDSQVLVKMIMKEMGISKDKMNPKAVLAHIGGAKNALKTPEQYSTQAHSYFSEQVAKIYTVYQKRLGQNQALDFEDILMKTVQLFEREPQVLNELQERFQYISVDEYQDTNHAQYTIIRMLAEKYRNLCVVGDDWQSIYSWRGATMRNILDFEKDYPEAATILLEQNYRSTAVILDASHAVIEKNKSRTEKKLWTEQEGGDKIKVWIARDERDEGQMIAKEIQKQLLSHESPDYREFAVLYRTNAQSRVIEESMMRYGIPYRVIGGVKFYSRKEIKDLLSYLRLIVNPADTVSLMRIINTPSRKIGSKTIEQLQDLSRARGDVPIMSILSQIETIGPENGFNDGKIRALSQFVVLIAKLHKINQEFPASGVIKHLIEFSGFKEFLLDGSPEGEARYENIQELVSVASKYDKLEPGISLATFLEEVALISDLDKIEEQENAVVMMTLHSAKGLEFPNVFICGLEEGIFPHSRSLLEPNELEEERRLMYVGLTRAMKRAYLLCAERRLLYGEMKQNSPSQFIQDIPEDLVESNQVDLSALAEGEGGILGKFLSKTSYDTWPPTGPAPSNMKRVPMESKDGFYADNDHSAYDGIDEAPEDLIEYEAGDRVRHNAFGEGVVAKVQGGVLTIAFKDPKHGVKKLAASVAPLEKLA